MSAHRYCMEVIGTWTVGSNGECLHSNGGFRLGPKGFRKAALQVNCCRTKEGFYIIHLESPVFMTVMDDGTRILKTNVVLLLT